MRRLLSRRWCLLLVLAASVLGIVYVYTTWRKLAFIHQRSKGAAVRGRPGDLTTKEQNPSGKRNLSHPSPTASFCLENQFVHTDMDTADILPHLDFTAGWIPQREFWSESLQKRYVRTRQKLWAKQPLKVILMPHSHNDPGWLKTAEDYFNADTKDILNNAVDKLTKYRNMTFVWTEMYFLSKWWETAHPSRKKNLKALVAEGRFEVLTGGWVMTDEANVDVFAMVDQLIEGHSWLRTTFGNGAEPTSSWSVDPFGHGGTFPYLLKSSGIDGMVIMRIHYAWKEFFAKHRSGDFVWRQRWDRSGESGILCHNFPYDIYSVKGSCGPQADVCVQFNFAAKATAEAPATYDNLPVFVNNQYANTKFITPSNIKERTELLLDQYGKTGSLFSHNVVLVPLGEDFLYSSGAEWDVQYANYKALMDYVNSRSDSYKAELRFGTLKDYFSEVRARTSSFPTLNGDFFVYSDVFSDGYPAYWSGYFTTRPFMKQLCRRLESKLRSAEILFSLAFHRKGSAVPSWSYNRLLVASRQSLALFQHHDAITGTSKQFVMQDYRNKLLDGLAQAEAVHKLAIESVMGLAENSFGNIRNFLKDVDSGNAYVLVFNSLANDKFDVVSFFLDDPEIARYLCIVDPNDDGQLLEYQVNPKLVNNANKFVVDTKVVEVVFTARLPALSLSRFKVTVCRRPDDHQEKTKVYCLDCPQSSSLLFDMDAVADGTVQIESSRFLLTFDQDSRLLREIREKKWNDFVAKLEVQIAGYPTQKFRSGSYLFATKNGAELVGVFHPKSDLEQVLIVSGSVFTEISLCYRNGEEQLEPYATLVHTVRLYQDVRSALSKGIYIENVLDLGHPSNFEDVDVFMRIKTTTINNGNVFFTDQNGFQMQKRSKISRLDVNANIYPITSMTYIQDQSRRMTLIVDHAAAATSWQPGWLEVIMDRRAEFDDGRGMGEGIKDSEITVHRYWLLLEAVSPVVNTDRSSSLNLPTKLANFLSRRLNFPSLQWIGLSKTIPNKDSLRFLTKSFPCDLHLFNFRTVASIDSFDQPGNASLLLLHAQASSFCPNAGDGEDANNLECDRNVNNVRRGRDVSFDMKISTIFKTTLTGGSPKEVKEIHLPDPMTIDTYKLEF